MMTAGAAAAVTAGLLMPVTPVGAASVPIPLTTTAQFDVLVPTANPAQSYQAVYSLTPVGWTHSVGTVYFYLGPAAESTTGALEQALLNAPTVVQQDIQREIAHYTSITPPNLDTPPTSVQLNGATPNCGNTICQRYEEMKYCDSGDPTRSGSGGCGPGGSWRTVDGVFSYDNNGAYAHDNGPQGGDFVDCSQNGGTYSSSYSPPEDRHMTDTWCGYWNEGPWSDTTHSFMDYGMNVDVYTDGNHYSAWIRMDDYAGCGSVGNRGGSSQ